MEHVDVKAPSWKLMLLAGCIASLIAVIWAVGGPAPSANATVQPFCQGYSAAPFGQPGDSCANGTFHVLNGVTGKGVQHSGCVNALNTGGALITSWVCQVPNVEASLGTCCGQTLRGIVRNNTTGATNTLYGWDYY
jgi:hypothetical protein